MSRRRAPAILGKKRPDRFTLQFTVLDHEQSPWAQQLQRPLTQHSHDIEPVRAAVQRHRRVEKPHLRQLAYTVVTAIEAARRLFEPVPDGEAFHSDALAKLARTRNADEASLVDFLEKQQDDVRTFVEAMLHE